MRIAKGGSMFCYPEHIPAEMARVFGELRTNDYLRGRTVDRFAAEAAHFLAELNAIHPFRDGNGRTQLAFMASLASQARRPLNLGKLNPDTVLAAVIESFKGTEAPLAGELKKLMV